MLPNPWDQFSASQKSSLERVLNGEALSREKRGLRATCIYTGKDLPAGYRYVGYEAGGPKCGPLTIAKIRSKIDTESGDRINHDVRELVRRNGGV